MNINACTKFSGGWLSHECSRSAENHSVWQGSCWPLWETSLLSKLCGFLQGYLCPKTQQASAKMLRDTAWGRDILPKKERFTFWGIGGYCIFFRLEITAVWTKSVGKNKSLIVYLCICVFVYLYFCICAFDTWEYHFWHPWTILFSKIYHMVGLSGTLSYAVFVYLCVCVFVYLYFCICAFDTWE